MTPRQEQLGIGAGALGLVLVLVAEWLAGGAAPRVAAAPPPRAPTATTPAEARDSAVLAETVTARPLFSIGRKPPRAPTGPRQVATGGAMPRLSGIMISGRDRRAIFMPDTGKPIVLAEGASLDDLRVASIRPDGVVLRGAKGDTFLRPAYDKAHAPATGIPGLPGSPGFQPLNQGIFNPGLGVPNINRPMFPPPPPNAAPPPQAQPNVNRTVPEDGADDAGGNPPPPSQNPGDHD